MTSWTPIATCASDLGRLRQRQALDKAHPIATFTGFTPHSDGSTERAILIETSSSSPGLHWFIHAPQSARKEWTSTMTRSELHSGHCIAHMLPGDG